MIIQFDEIITHLREEGINYICKGIPEKAYQIASVFSPIEGGFYFFSGTILPESIKKSLILTNFAIEISPENENVFLLIEEDSQREYYRLLHKNYGRKSNGRVSSTAVIHPKAKLGKNVEIGNFCIIEDCVIQDNVIIGSHCVIHNSTEIESNCIIESHSVIGATGVAWVWDTKEENRIIQPQLGGVVIQSGCFIGAHGVIVKGSINENTIIGKHTLIAPGVRVGHGTQIGAFTHFANNIITGGNTIIGDYCFIGSSAVFRPKVKVHSHTIVGTGALVIKDTSTGGLTLMGAPAKEFETKESPSGMPKPKRLI